MNLNQLSEKTNIIINEIKNNGIYTKENDFIDYKKELNHFNLTDEIEIFFRNFAKDILSFTNNKGGIILIGFEENRTSGKIYDTGLNDADLELLNKIDLNKIHQKLDSITKCNFGIELQMFTIVTRKFFYLLIEKNNDVTIPLNDYPNYKLKKGDIIHRISGKNEVANENSQKINRFLQRKADEKSKDFMEIWSKLLPEIFHINPKEILMINPKSNMIYGYNQKDKNLLGSEIDVDKSEEGAFNIILNAISAGEIGKISDTEGKPLYRIVGEINTNTLRDQISLSTLQSEVKKMVKYNFSNPQIKMVMKELNWVNDAVFQIERPKKELINKDFEEFMWVENLDIIKGTKKIVFSKEAIKPIVDIINDNNLHKRIFGKELSLK